MGVDLRLEPAALVVQLFAEVFEEADVDADTGLFHLRQYRDERLLDLFVEVAELARSDRFCELIGEAFEDGNAAAGFLRAGVAVEVERAGFLIGRDEFEREIAKREVFES